MSGQKRVVVFGLGYVGCVTAACFAELGHAVTGVDKDAAKVSNILNGHAPFFEPGLEALVAANVTAGTLTATTDTAAALQNADIALICVGTPSERNGNLSLDQLRRVSEEIRQKRQGDAKPLILAVRSTVFPGTCEEVVQPLFADDPAVSIVSNPEFLREGSAVQDFREPSLVVVGGMDPKAVGAVAELYQSLGVLPCLVSLRTAEMIKYACNAFHAVKIGFANEVGALSAVMGIDAHEVMSTLCQDTRLNISTAYLKPGFAFGGSCLPKDLRALTYRATRLDLDLPMLMATLPSNNAHLLRAIHHVLELPVENIGILGLAFKENTDDLRESPVVALLEHLIGKGRALRVYDPHIHMDSIYGANRNFILNAIPHIGRLLEPRVEDVLNWAQYLVVAQKPSPELVEKIRHSGVPVLDLVGTAHYWTAAEPVAVPNLT
jgi:GDP-mannose 6-dehydrogenase